MVAREDSPPVPTLRVGPDALEGRHSLRLDLVDGLAYLTLHRLHKLAKPPSIFRDVHIIKISTNNFNTLIVNFFRQF